MSKFLRDSNIALLGYILYPSEKLCIDEAERMFDGEESLRILRVSLEYIDILRPKKTCYAHTIV